MSIDFMFKSGQVLNWQLRVFNCLNMHDLSLYLLVIIVIWMLIEDML